MFLQEHFDEVLQHCPISFEFASLRARSNIAGVGDVAQSVPAGTLRRKAIFASTFHRSTSRNERSALQRRTGTCFASPKGTNSDAQVFPQEQLVIRTSPQCSRRNNCTTPLEEEWGDEVMTGRQADAAVSKVFLQEHSRP
jgi:hypothetical protein